jgi:CheY-like chemotaxis protein
MGVGTTFTLLLPTVSKSQDEEITIPTHLSKGTGKILLMDDEEFILNMAGDMLKGIGYEVECAKNGEEALDLYKKAMKNKKKYDSVILDLTIRGGMGGEETIRELLKIDPGVKGIVSSGYSDSPVLSRPREHGFIGRVGKPYRKKELSHILQTIINA